jgi:hypothetical protein
VWKPATTSILWKSWSSNSWKTFESLALTYLKKQNLHLSQEVETTEKFREKVWKPGDNFKSCESLKSNENLYVFIS